MRAFLFVLEVTPLKVGHTYRRGLPLHCTVVNWFRTSTATRGVRIVDTVASIIQATPPIQLIAESEDWFGPRGGPQNILVNRIRPTKEFRELHDSLCQALAPLGIEHTEPTYVGDGFNPHVTKQAEGQFTEGSQHTSHVTYLVEAQNTAALNREFVVARILHAVSYS